MVNLFENGPYLHALGWIAGAQYEVSAANAEGLGALQRTMDFVDGSYPTLKTAVTSDELLAPLPKELLKSSGVPRARSAAKSTVLASILGKSLTKYVDTQPGFDGDRGSIGVVSNSAIVPVFWAFEGVGVGQSWDRTDTMLLPASIPSSVVTMVSTVTGFHASAASFGDGVAGMTAALEQAYLHFVHDRADYAVVIATEEACTPMMTSMQTLGIAREPIDGASGVLLTRKRLSASDWQICFAETFPEKTPRCMPPDWSAAPRIRVTYPDGCSAYTSTAAPQAMHAAMQLGAPKVVVEFVLKGHATCLIGLLKCT